MIKKHHLIIIFAFFGTLFAFNSKAYYDCSEYGPYAYSTGSGYCKCMTGYVWDTQYDGSKICSSGFLKCTEDYGLMTTYDSYSGQCKCLSGYIFDNDMFGNKKCISKDSYCDNKFGYNSRYNSLSDECECNYGYELSIKTYGTGYECKSCSVKYGSHSSYNSSLKQCECDNGYTLKDGECVEKNNSAYFLLKEADDNKREAIIESNYTNTCYYIKYGSDCRSYGIHRYVNHDIVINMGKDFYVDVADWLVLQDDDEACSLTNVKTIDCKYSINDVEAINTASIRQLLSNTCGQNSYLTNDNKCQCNSGYEWVDYNSKTNFDCKKQIIATNNQSSSNSNDFLTNEKSKITNIDKNLTNKLKGKILLQVEDKGEAWYVNPKDGKRHYMADGNEAYNVMRDLGIGIKNSDLEKIKNNKSLAKKQSGKIFLQVEDLGQAYYIDFNGNAHYLKDGAEAYTIMRNLGLGIKNSDLNKIDIK